MGYIWQLPDWPRFRWDEGRILPLLLHAARRASLLAGRASAVEGSDIDTGTIAGEIAASYSIEGVHLGMDGIRSSVERHLGIARDDARVHDRNAETAVDVFMEAVRDPDGMLSESQLHDWNARILSCGNSGVLKRGRGWRHDAVYVVSGSMGKPVIHFEAPPASAVPEEMARFLDFINEDRSYDPLLQAAIVHFWFVMIHPYPDGNGRMARLLMGRMLARTEGPYPCFSISKEIERRRAEYYRVLDHAGKGSLDITEYMEWFFLSVVSAVDYSGSMLDDAISKARVWDSLRDRDLNGRQRRIIGLLLDGFRGNLTADKWMKLCRCSHATAVRDINTLVGYGILKRSEGKARNSSYIPLV